MAADDPDRPPVTTSRNVEPAVSEPRRRFRFVSGLVCAIAAVAFAL